MPHFLITLVLLLNFKVFNAQNSIKTIDIPEVVVSEERKLKKKVIGFHRYLSVAVNVAEIDKQTEWALLFNPKKKWQIIEELYLKLDTVIQPDKAFTVRLRQVSSEGKPSAVVYEKMVKYNDLKGEKYLIIGLDTTIRIMDKGIFLSLEFADSGNCVRMTAKRNGEIGRHYFEGKEEKWKIGPLSRKAKGWTPWIPRFGIRVRNY